MTGRRDTITAISTPRGAEGIGVVRISGYRAFDILKNIFRPLTKDCPYESHKLYLGDIVNPSGEKIDKVFAVYMKSPATYTGEDIVEISCHGGSSIAEIIRDLIIEQGIREALPGEFTRRAFYEGKLDLTEAEAINELSRNTSRVGASIATSVLDGKLKTTFEKLKDKILNLLTLTETLIDFEEDAGDTINEDDIEKYICEIIENLTTLKNSYRKYLVLSRGMRVVIVGKKNTGKTTLFNTLLGEHRGIVSSYPGTTRDWLEGIIEIDGYNIKLTDTAGLGNAIDDLDILGMEKTHILLEEADLILFLIDPQTGFTDEDDEIFQMIKNEDFITIINKIDIAEEDTIIKIHNTISTYSDLIYNLSAKFGENIEQLISHIKQKALTFQTRDVHLITERQFNLTSRMLDNFKSSRTKLKAGAGLEEVAFFIQQALVNLEEIIGENISDDLLDKIFSKFCIGK
jgi:tRNA modification GTPase